MRSPIGPFLVLLGVATTAIGVLILFQSIGLRSDLDRSRAEVAALQAELESREGGVTDEQLVKRLDVLEAGIRDWLIATGADGGFDETPGGDPGSGSEDVVQRLDEILERVTALDDRVDEICEGVPVC